MPLFANVKRFFSCKKTVRTRQEDFVRTVRRAPPSPTKPLIGLNIEKQVNLAGDIYQRIPNLVTRPCCETYLQKKLACEDVRYLGSGAYGVGYSVIPSQASPILGQEQVERTKPVVIKVFKFGPGWSHDPETKLRHEVFQNEVKCYQKDLDHENVVKFLNSFEFHWNISKEEYGIEKSSPIDGQLLMGGIVLEKLECTLQDLVKKLKIKRLNDKLITALFYQIGGALVYLHGTHYLVHKDLKWDNIGVAGLSEDGVPHLKLLDFGNARLSTKAKFEAAERHSACYNLGLTMCEIRPVDSIFNDSILTEENAFLEESENFSSMMLQRAKPGNDMFYEAKIVFGDTNKDGNMLRDIPSQFEELEISDPKLKRLLIRMTDNKFSYQKISITSAMKYISNN